MNRKHLIVLIAGMFIGELLMNGYVELGIGLTIGTVFGIIMGHGD